MYSGFYAVHIRAHLRHVENIFMLMGYREERPHILRMDCPASSHLVDTACDCFIAANECQLIQKIADKASHTHCTMAEVFKSRQVNRGGIVKCVQWIMSMRHDQELSNHSPKKKVKADPHNSYQMDTHISDNDILPVVSNQLRDNCVDRLKSEESSRKSDKNKKQSRSLDDLLGMKSKMRSLSLRRGGSADGEMKGSKPRHERSLHRSRELEDSQIATSIRPKSSSLSRSKKSSRSSSKSTLSDLEPSELNMAYTPKKECIGPDEMYHEPPPPPPPQQPTMNGTDDHEPPPPPPPSVNGTVRLPRQTSENLTSEEYDIYEPRTHDDHLRKSLKVIENLAKSPKADHMSRFSLPPIQPDNIDGQPSQLTAFEDMDTLPIRRPALAEKRHKSHEQLGESGSWPLPPASERSESMSQLGAVGGTVINPSLDRPRPGSMYENVGGHQNFENVHCDYRPRGDSANSHMQRPRVENVVLMKSRSQGSSPVYTNTADITLGITSRGNHTGGEDKLTEPAASLPEDIHECDSDEDDDDDDDDEGDLEDCTPFAKPRETPACTLADCPMSASMTRSLAGSDGSGPPSNDSSGQDPFVENCSQCSSGTVKRGGVGSSKGEALEHHFRSMLLAKDDHSTASYGVSTFSTFGKDLGPDPYSSTLPTAPARSRTSTLGYATSVDAGEETGWPDVLENTPKQNKPPSPPPRSSRTARTEASKSVNHVNDYLPKGYHHQPVTTSPPVMKRNGVSSPGTQEKLLPPPRKGRLRGQANPPSRTLGLVVSDGCEDPRAPKMAAVPPTDWQCNSCTFSNPPGTTVCAMCHKSQTAGPESEPLQQGSPVCASCTYVNEIGASLCSMCDKRLGGGGTFIWHPPTWLLLPPIPELPSYWRSPHLYIWPPLE